jgi:UPF0755 protein
LPKSRITLAQLRTALPPYRLTAFTALSALTALACGSHTTTTRVTLPPGASFSAVTDSLHAHGVISSPIWFKLLARVRGLDRSVRAGIYEFSSGTSSWTVLDILAEGKAVSLRLTVPEGLTILELAHLASERVGMPEDSVLAAARDTAAAHALLGFSVQSFEGFLHPETYSLSVATRPADLVRTMAEGFKNQWEPEWTSRLDTLGMTKLQVVTLASIVEGEARADDEREIIAGVYYNRLRIGMALQADPTIQYAIALKTGNRKPRLYEKDYHFPSPYNTYLHPGLPPGPVNSPGRRSIEATLYPARVPYLYFVAGPDGRHIFSRTYDEHLRAVARVRKAAR